MLSSEQNKLVTEVENGSPCGRLLRNYWQPAALTEELTSFRAAKAVRIFGEDLVVFRDEEGNYGLIDRACPHRGADLCYGRLEDGGIRCPFHGWLFDVDGQCLDQPAEPEGSKFNTKIKIKAYPCVERNGIIFTYMGEGPPPSLPEIDCLQAPDAHSFAFKGYLECNWLQATEVGIDPSHASYLHRYLEDHDPEYGLQFAGKSGEGVLNVTAVLREYNRPNIEIENTEFGMRLLTTRDIDKDTMHVRVTNLVFPNLIVIPMTNDMVISQWHVPIDDTHSWWYAMFTSYEKEVDKETMGEQRRDLYTFPDYRPKINKINNYGYDPEEQRTKTYTGMGMDINVHDQWAVESPGAIFNRENEHLGAADKGIIRFRKVLIKSIAEVMEGNPTPFMFNSDNEDLKGIGPVAIDTTTPRNSWKEDWQSFELDRRKSAAWTSKETS